MPSPAVIPERATADAAGAARRFGFSPAFLDRATMRIHHARFADGSPAPFHVLDGLPVDVVADTLSSGRVVRAKATLITGFERGGFFYTCTATARACEQWAAALPFFIERRPLLPLQQGNHP